MKKILNDDAPLRRYLLGLPAPGEEPRVEERLITDDDYFNHLEIVEDDLIDDYARGKLNPREREQFEKRFLVTTERRSKLRLAKALIEHANRNASVADPSPGLLDRLRRFLPLPLPVPAFGVALALLAVVVGYSTYRLVVPSSTEQYASLIQDGLQNLAEAYIPERPLRSRISSLEYAPFSDTRGNAPLRLVGANQTKLDYAMNVILKQAIKNPTPQAFHAAGRYYLTQEKFSQAISQLDSALRAGKENLPFNHTEKAQVYSDYAVALMEQAKDVKEKDPVKYEKLMADSRERLEEALKLDAGLPEALFNRGLLLQERRLWKQAEEAWDRYLQIDSASHWAGEARKYRGIASEESRRQVSQDNDDVLRDFLDAYRANDKGKAERLIAHNREPVTGRIVWLQLTDAYLNAARQGDADYARFLLQALSHAGQLELEKGDRFTSDLALLYRSLSPQQHDLISEAHREMDQGNKSYLGPNPGDALGHYERAGTLFRQARNQPEACLADLMIGFQHYQRNDAKRSVLLLSQLAKTCRNKQYLSLLVQVLGAVSAAHFTLRELSKTQSYTEEAVEVADRIGDVHGLHKNLTQLANFHDFLDDFDQSLSNLHRCLEEAPAGWPGMRQMWRTYTLMAQVLISSRLYAAATDFQKEALWLASNGSKDHRFLASSYTRLAFSYGQMGYASEANNLAQIAYSESRQSNDNKTISYALLQLGHIYRQSGDYDQAISHYNQALEMNPDTSDLVYSARKGRLISFLSQKNDAIAKDEIQRVLDIAEGYRQKILAENRSDSNLDEKSGHTFFAAEQSFFDIAIDFECSRGGSAERAFELSEQSRARSLLELITSRQVSQDTRSNNPAFLSTITRPLTLREIQERLPEQSQILQYAALEDKLLIWVISKTGVKLAKKKIRLSDLQDQALEYWSLVADPNKNKASESELSQKAKALYDILIAPAESQKLLDKEKTICVVPDKALNYLPFNALVSTATGKYLVNEYRLTFAPSATVYLICTEWAQRRDGRIDERLLSVGNPSFDTELHSPLPSSEREANQVAALYRSPAILLGQRAREEAVKSSLNKFDVLHLATHYIVDDRSPMRSKLVLARESGGADQAGQPDGYLQNEEIYRRSPLPARLVVLSACQSGVERYFNGEGMIGMSRTFIASGVPLVVSSLWEVDSDATAELMINLHKYRKQKDLSTAEALRLAQLEMSNSQNNHPNYWASFIVIGGHAGY